MMPEPLSIAAGVVSVLSAAARISKKLCDFIQKTVDARKRAQIILAEVNDITSILSNRQGLISEGIDVPD